jgi:hypothetical protein
MRKRSPSVPSLPKEQNPDLARFAVKAFVFSVIFSAVFAVGLSVSLNTVLPDVYSVERLLEKIGGQVGNELEKDRNRIRLVGFLTHNPYVHYRISQIEEQAGRLDSAVEEIELALGLFELGPPNNPAKEKYLKRLNELQRKKHQAALPRG